MMTTLVRGEENENLLFLMKIPKSYIEGLPENRDLLFKRRSIESSAAYHKFKSPSAPNASKMRKNEVLLALPNYGISNDPKNTAVEAKLKLRKWVKANIEAEIV